MNARQPRHDLWRAALVLVGIGCAAFAWAADRALYWSIHESGELRGHLLGTIHSEDPRVLDFSPEFLQTLAGSRVFAMELLPDLVTLGRLTERMTLPEGQGLEELAGAERFAAAVKAMQPYGVLPDRLARMQPWAVVMTLSLPPPETGLFMDFSLSLRASGSGLEVIGLETLDQQLAFLEGMDLQQQLRLLDHAVAEVHQVGALHDQMLERYLANDLTRLQQEAMDQLADLDQDLRETFISEGIEARNRRMLENMLPQLAKGDAFIAVGALHLPGEAGLLALLRGAGYSLQPAGWPFIAEP